MFNYVPDASALTLDLFEKSKPIAVWIGKHLLHLRTRESKTIVALAELISCSTEELEMLEAGKFHFKAGRIKQLLEAYNVTLLGVLEKWARECAQKDESLKTFFPKERPFSRKAYYSVRLVPSNKLPETPLFVAGDPERFVWAVPLRKLKKGEASVELLELAESRAKDHGRGTTKLKTARANAHIGTEIVYVIRGRIEQYVDTENTGEYLHRTLGKGDMVHFDSTRPHYVENASNNATALLLITRMPGL